MNVVAVGLGVTGMAVARYATSQGWSTVIVEDDPSRDGHTERVAEAAAAGAEVAEAPDEVILSRLVSTADLVVPSPGVAVGHPVYRLAEAHGRTVVSEIELASRATEIPMVAVTGTNGKTTVTTLVASMLEASGLRSTAAGNIGRPLLDAIADDLDVIVAEVSYFQLQFTDRFRPHVAVVLNVSNDHLDWHPTVAHYRAAKARIFANQQPGDVAVLNADDAAVASMAPEVRASVVWFRMGSMEGAYRPEGNDLVTPTGDVIVALDELPRALPHDVANAAAASAAAFAAGATLDGVAATLRQGRSLPHTLALVGEAGGVRWYDDSKATNPHATLAALAGFDSVVLLAGGRNKGLSLEPLREAAPRIRAVVAFGEAGPEVEAVFRGVRPVARVVTMRDAVDAGASFAEPGDAVILSPACASFDAYDSYRARGDDFTREVERLVGSAPPQSGVS